MFYRYLAFDDAGPYALLSQRPLEPLVRPEVRLLLLERTPNWRAALRAHRELESFLDEVIGGTGAYFPAPQARSVRN